MTMDGATTQFEARPAAAAGARRFVVGLLGGWGLPELEDEAALCTAELATNAILHGRTPFTVSARPIPGGLRIDVQDDRPDRLPAALPVVLDPLASGATGRGLRLVAAVSTRWGWFTTDRAKTVWTELTVGHLAGPTEPVVEVVDRPGPAGRSVRLELPVQTAIASGRQLDDLVREVQLEPERLDPGERARFDWLLEASARLRLIGRHEAFWAAARGLDHYTLELVVSADELAALRDLVRLLEELAAAALLEAGKVPADVEAMRAWLSAEVAAQLAGWPRTPYPGIDQR